MKLELNIKEWLSLYGLLERNIGSDDKYLFEVHTRMRSTLASILQDAHRDQLDRWIEFTNEKMKSQPVSAPVVPSEVLTDDDEVSTQEAREYPRKPRSGGQQGGGGRRRKG